MTHTLQSVWEHLDEEIKELGAGFVENSEGETTEIHIFYKPIGILPLKSSKIDETIKVHFHWLAGGLPADIFCYDREFKTVEELNYYAKEVLQAGKLLFGVSPTQREDLAPGVVKN